MKKYKMKERDFEAMQVTAESAADVAAWCGGVVIEEMDAIDQSIVHLGVNLMSKNGAVRASEGNYVVLTDDGDFDVVPKHLFEEGFQETQGTVDWDIDNNVPLYTSDYLKMQDDKKMPPGKEAPPPQDEDTHTPTELKDPSRRMN